MLLQVYRPPIENIKTPTARKTATIIRCPSKRKASCKLSDYHVFSNLLKSMCKVSKAFLRIAKST